MTAVLLTIGGNVLVFTLTYPGACILQRQLFDAGCIQSGFFHRFVCTVHSPVGKNPAEYGIRLKPLPPIRFATNDVGFIDRFVEGLHVAGIPAAR